jgi:hypothetical protein
MAAVWRVLEAQAHLAVTDADPAACGSRGRQPGQCGAETCQDVRIVAIEHHRGSRPIIGDFFWRRIPADGAPGVRHSGGHQSLAVFAGPGANWVMWAGDEGCGAWRG